MYVQPGTGLILSLSRTSYSFVFLLLIMHRLTSVGVETVEWSSAKLLLVSLLSHGGDKVMETAYQRFIVRSVCVP